MKTIRLFLIIFCTFLVFNVNAQTTVTVNVFSSFGFLQLVQDWFISNPSVIIIASGSESEGLGEVACRSSNATIKNMICTNKEMKEAMNEATPLYACLGKKAKEVDETIAKKCGTVVPHGPCKKVAEYAECRAKVNGAACGKWGKKIFHNICKAIPAQPEGSSNFDPCRYEVIQTLGETSQENSGSHENPGPPSPAAPPPPQPPASIKVYTSLGFLELVQFWLISNPSIITIASSSQSAGLGEVACRSSIAKIKSTICFNKKMKKSMNEATELYVCMSKNKKKIDETISKKCGAVIPNGPCTKVAAYADCQAKVNGATCGKWGKRIFKNIFKSIPAQPEGSPNFDSCRYQVIETVGSTSHENSGSHENPGPPGPPPPQPPASIKVYTSLGFLELVQFWLISNPSIITIASSSQSAGLGSVACRSSIAKIKSTICFNKEMKESMNEATELYVCMSKNKKKIDEKISKKCGAVIPNGPCTKVAAYADCQAKVTGATCGKWGKRIFKNIFKSIPAQPEGSPNFDACRYQVIETVGSTSHENSGSHENPGPPGPPPPQPPASIKVYTSLGFLELVQFWLSSNPSIITIASSSQSAGLGSVACRSSIAKIKSTICFNKEMKESMNEATELYVCMSKNKKKIDEKISKKCGAVIPNGPCTKVAAYADCQAKVNGATCGKWGKRIFKNIFKSIPAQPKGSPNFDACRYQVIETVGSTSHENSGSHENPGPPGPPPPQPPASIKVYTSLGFLELVQFWLSSNPSIITIASSSQSAGLGSVACRSSIAKIKSTICFNKEMKESMNEATELYVCMSKNKKKIDEKISKKCGAVIPNGPCTKVAAYADCQAKVTGATCGKWGKRIFKNIFKSIPAQPESSPNFDACRYEVIKTVGSSHESHSGSHEGPPGPPSGPPPTVNVYSSFGFIALVQSWIISNPSVIVIASGSGSKGLGEVACRSSNTTIKKLICKNKKIKKEMNEATELFACYSKYSKGIDATVVKTCGAVVPNGPCKKVGTYAECQAQVYGNACDMWGKSIFHGIYKSIPAQPEGSPNFDACRYEVIKTVGSSHESHSGSHEGPPGPPSGPPPTVNVYSSFGFIALVQSWIISNPSVIMIASGSESKGLGEVACRSSNTTIKKMICKNKKMKKEMNEATALFTCYSAYSNGIDAAVLNSCGAMVPNGPCTSVATYAECQAEVYGSSCAMWGKNVFHGIFKAIPAQPESSPNFDPCRYEVIKRVGSSHESHSSGSHEGPPPPPPGPPPTVNVFTSFGFIELVQAWFISNPSIIVIASGSESQGLGEVACRSTNTTIRNLICYNKKLKKAMNKATPLYACIAANPKVVTVTDQHCGFVAPHGPCTTVAEYANCQAMVHGATCNMWGKHIYHDIYKSIPKQPPTSPKHDPCRWEVIQRVGDDSYEKHSSHEGSHGGSHGGSHEGSNEQDSKPKPKRSQHWPFF
ncbi:unnamed protein product, partial [Mesorhabditis belari]|uniref:Uncharacterized protein n=1 Tax=Mesorhabditis belari TaxID=2138241 RepID=A0AAF3EU23_9BILA